MNMRDRWRRIWRAYWWYIIIVACWIGIMAFILMAIPNK